MKKAEPEMYLGVGGFQIGRHVGRMPAHAMICRCQTMSSAELLSQVRITHT